MFLILLSFIFAYFNLQDHPVIVESESESETEDEYETEDEITLEYETEDEKDNVTDEVEWINLNSHPVEDVSESSDVSVKI